MGCLPRELQLPGDSIPKRPISLELYPEPWWYDSDDSGPSSILPLLLHPNRATQLRLSCV